MKAVLFDPFSGASGDMIIGALIDLGADKGKVKEAMETAADVSVEFSKTLKKNISACAVDVKTGKEKGMTLQEIIKRIGSLSLPRDIVKNAISVFRILGKAEAEVHTASHHFHELGQEDAVADIVGACAAFHDMGLKNCRIYCNAISTGSGFVEFSHGKFPVPAPATLEILKESSLPWQHGCEETELLTPTGAALLAHFVSEAGACPPMKTERIGYGAGSRETRAPNVLRIIFGEIDDSLVSERIEVLETNVDDVTGQVLGNLIHELLRANALDAAIIPATMKKGRSGHIIQVISRLEDSSMLARKIMEETGSLGVRIIPVKHRLILQREMHTVEVKINGRAFSIPVKVARDKRGTLLNISAEFEDCKKASEESGVPVRDVIRLAEEAARKNLS